MTSKRYHEPSIKREIILRAAVEAARRPGGWSKLTRRGIASIAGCSDALVSQRIGDMPTVRRTVMKYAIKHEILEIIVQSIGAHDGYAVKKWLPAALKQRAIATLLG